MSDVLIEILKGIVSIFVMALPIFCALLFIFAWQNRRKATYLEKNEYTVLQMKIPKNNDKTPTAAEMMFATLHGILRPKTEIVRQGKIQEHLSFEMVADSTTIRFFIWTPRHLKDFVEGQIYAQYPSAEITEIEDYSLKDPEEGKHFVSAAEIRLTKDDVLPIKTFNNFTVDPLAGITGVLAKLENSGEEIWIQILAKPEPETWKRKGLDWIQKKKTGRVVFSGDNIFAWLMTEPIRIIIDIFNAIFIGPPQAVVPGQGKTIISTEDESRVSAVEEKTQKLGYLVKVRMIYRGKDKALIDERLNAIFGAFKQFNTTNLNGFTGKKIHNVSKAYSDYRNRIFDTSWYKSHGFHLNIEELASIYHLPHTSVETPNINWTTSKTGEPPTTLPDVTNTDAIDLSLFGETNFRSHRQVFGIKRDDRRRHMYIIGKSGMGKTKLMENMINDDIKKGEGVAVIDPHGDLIMDTLKKIPDERINDVIIFDPSDREFPIAYNPMEVIDDNLKIQIASGIVGTFKKIFGDSWGPRLEYVLNYTVLALLDTEGSTLLGVVQMLTDKNLRKKIIDNIQDPVVKKFWTTEFASYSEKFATEAIAPILNKVGQFTANSLIRNIIGQPYSTFNIRRVMDEGKILLINLSTGRVGETNASLLGSMMITSIQLAAMSRADIPEDDRKDFYLYVDEFQNFATESFAVILSEARKYRLSLIMGNQYISQMDDKVREAVFGNVGTMVSFRVGAQDASVLEREFNPPFEAQDLINLPRQQVYIRMTIDGMSEQSFSAKTLTVTSDTTGNVKEIVTKSREKFTHPREEVEPEVARWAGISDMIAGGQKPLSGAIETAKTAIESTDVNFEAPLVKKAGKKGRQLTSDAVKSAIAESTAHLNKETTETKTTPPHQPQKNDVIDEVKKNDFLISPELTQKYFENNADYIVRHKDGDDKFIFLPSNKPDFLIPDNKGRVKGHEYIKNGRKIYDVKVDMYEPSNHGIFPKSKAPDIWVGDISEVIEQLKAISEGEGGGFKFLGIESKSGDEKILNDEIIQYKNSLKKTGDNLKIKDKIDKEILSDILKMVVEPKDKHVSDKKEINNIQQSSQEKITANREVIKKSEPEIQPIRKKEPEVPKKENQFPSSGKEKIITPENFKKIKTIHPHEIVKIASDNKSHQIKEGEVIKFN